MLLAPLHAFGSPLPQTLASFSEPALGGEGLGVRGQDRAAIRLFFNAVGPLIPSPYPPEYQGRRGPDCERLAAKFRVPTTLTRSLKLHSPFILGISPPLDHNSRTSQPQYSSDIRATLWRPS